PEPGSGPGVLYARSQLPLLRSHHDAGIEFGGLDRCGHGPVWRDGAVSQRLPLAAPAGRIRESGESFPARQGRQSQLERPHRVPERLQSDVPGFSVRGQSDGYGSDHEPVCEWNARCAFERLRLREFGERLWLPAAKRADGRQADFLNHPELVNISPLPKYGWRRACFWAVTLLPHPKESPPPIRGVIVDDLLRP